MIFYRAEQHGIVEEDLFVVVLGKDVLESVIALSQCELNGRTWLSRLTIQIGKFDARFGAAVTVKASIVLLN